MIDRLCPPSCLSELLGDVGAFLSHDRSSQSPLCQELDSPISEDELKAAIRGTKLKSTPGLDQIDNQIITALPESYIQVLNKIFNMHFASGEVPEDWRCELVLLIPKPSGGGLRPISLLSCLRKLMGRIIAKRLSWYMETNCLFLDSQFGFRCERSCADSIVALTSFNRASFGVGKVVVGTFIDIKGVFDDVIPAILMRDLIDLGVPALVRKFVNNLIMEREA